MITIGKTILVLVISIGWMVRSQAQIPGAAQVAQTAPGAFVSVEGSKLYYEECGTGPEAVVLLHDGIAHSAVWDDVWPTFCKHLHVIRYDRRGYGRSPATTTWYSETEDLATLLHSRKIKSAILVGSSHGGELSIDFTLQYPSLVKKLVLVGAVLSGFPYTDHFLNRGMGNSAPFEKGDVTKGLSNWSKDKYLLAPGHEAAQKCLVTIVTANPQDMTHADFARPSKPSFSHLSEIRVPTLILVGDADIPDVHAHAGASESGIAGSKRMIISDSGHLMYLEKLGDFSHVVISFIESNID